MQQQQCLNLASILVFAITHGNLLYWCVNPIHHIYCSRHTHLQSFLTSAHLAKLLSSGTFITVSAPNCAHRTTGTVLSTRPPWLPFQDPKTTSSTSHSTSITTKAIANLLTKDDVKSLELCAAMCARFGVFLDLGISPPIYLNRYNRTAVWRCHLVKKTLHCHSHHKDAASINEEELKNDLNSCLTDMRITGADFVTDEVRGFVAGLVLDNLVSLHGIDIFPNQAACGYRAQGNAPIEHDEDRNNASALAVAADMAHGLSTSDMPSS